MSHKSPISSCIKLLQVSLSGFREYRPGASDQKQKVTRYTPADESVLPKGKKILWAINFSGFCGACLSTNFLPQTV